MGEVPGPRGNCGSGSEDADGVFTQPGNSAADQAASRFGGDAQVLEGAYFAKQRELEAVMGRLQDIPAKPLTTPQQALFALGYYHQRAAISSGIRERVAAKKARTDLPTDTDSTQGASA